MNTFVGQHGAELSAFQQVLWWMYLLAAVMLPVCHVRPILKYLRGSGGIGDACIRTEAIQCLWRVPALMFSMFVAPSLPLFLSIFLDLTGRIGRVLAMRASQRRWHAGRASLEHRVNRPDPVWHRAAGPVRPMQPNDPEWGPGQPDGAHKKKSVGPPIDVLERLPRGC